MAASYTSTFLPSFLYDVVAVSVYIYRIQQLHHHPLLLYFLGSSLLGHTPATVEYTVIQQIKGRGALDHEGGLESVVVSLMIVV